MCYFLHLNVISLMPKGPPHFGSVAGTRVGNASMAVTWVGEVLLVVKVGRAITFWQKMKIV
jgi:hypothetical protein